MEKIPRAFSIHVAELILFLSSSSACTVRTWHSESVSLLCLSFPILSSWSYIHPWRSISIIQDYWNEKLGREVNYQWAHRKTDWNLSGASIYFWIPFAHHFTPSKRSDSFLLVSPCVHLHFAFPESSLLFLEPEEFTSQTPSCCQNIPWTDFSLLKHLCCAETLVLRTQAPPPLLTAVQKCSQADSQYAAIG